MRTLDDVPLAPAERQAIEAAAAALRASFPVTEIVLFGSKARGDSDPESDIDLLVLTARKLAWQEERTIIHELFDIGMRFDVVFSPLTIEARSWREGLHSVLPIHTEVEREGVRCGLQGYKAPADGTSPPSDQVPSAPASREALVKQVAGEWMGMAEEALASARAEMEAQRWRSGINRAYYAAFYAVSAVLLSRSLHFVKHAGVQTALHRDLIRPGLLAVQHGNAYDELFKLRLIADYTVTGLDADQATRSLRQAEAIVAEMRRLLAAQGIGL
jgi:uncharacterized protein (UPF0332 family)/predicted nucleotidyltransferase